MIFLSTFDLSIQSTVYFFLINVRRRIYLGLYICHKFSDLLPDLIVCFSLEVEIVSITALNLARMELELDLHLQQVGLNRFIEVASYTFDSNLENGCILK